MSTAGGIGLPGSGDAAGVELSGTVQQRLVFLNTHWGSKYSFIAPPRPGGRWTAVARFGQHDELAAESAADLLELVRSHARWTAWRACCRHGSSGGWRVPMAAGASRWRRAGFRPLSADVARLYRQGRLGEIAGLGPASIRDIGASLAAHGLADAADGDAIVAGCPVDCLRAVMSGRVLNRLARADGRGVAVASGGPPATVGEVVRRYREGRLGQIAGLGARSISEIEAALVLAGLVIDGSDPASQPGPAGGARAVALAAAADGTRRSARPGGRNGRPGARGG
jgi:hypothetical protein